jgi:hypothetical protein
MLMCARSDLAMQTMRDGGDSAQATADRALLLLKITCAGYGTVLLALVGVLQATAR